MRKNTKSENEIVTVHKSYIYLIVLLCGFFSGVLLKLSQYTSLKTTLLHKIDSNTLSISQNHKDTLKLLEKYEDNQDFIKNNLANTNLTIARLIVKVNYLQQHFLRGS